MCLTSNYFCPARPPKKLRAEAVEVAGIRAFRALSDRVGVLAAPPGFDGEGRFFLFEFEQAAGGFFQMALTQSRPSSSVMLAIRKLLSKSSGASEASASLPNEAAYLRVPPETQEQIDEFWMKVVARKAAGV